MMQLHFETLPQRKQFLVIYKIPNVQFVKKIKSMSQKLFFKLPNRNVSHITDKNLRLDCTCTLILEEQNVESLAFDSGKGGKS